MNLIKRIFRSKRLLLVILLPVVVFGLFYLYQKKVNADEPENILEVTYDGHTPEDPIFVVTNMLPGDSISKIFKVSNLSSTSFNIGMKAILKEEEKEFADILEIIISEVGFGDIYGGSQGFKTLQNYLDEPDPLDLGNFGSESFKNFKIEVKFPTSAGNEYQLAKVVFDLQWSADIEGGKIPPECKHLPITKIVSGTEENDKIYGSTASELILGKGGNDKISASSSGDCIFGGDGNDHIDSESGDDVVFGGDGNDKIKTGYGNDTVFGGDGNDNIDTGTGDDKVWGGEGQDNIDGGNDNDELHGGLGNDVIRGGGGNDLLYGDEGNDTIHAGSGNDYLNGGPDTDNLHGNSGTDTCEFGESVNSCEL